MDGWIHGPVGEQGRRRLLRNDVHFGKNHLGIFRSCGLSDDVTVTG